MLRQPTTHRRDSAAFQSFITAILLLVGRFVFLLIAIICGPASHGSCSSRRAAGEQPACGRVSTEQHHTRPASTNSDDPKRAGSPETNNPSHTTTKSSQRCFVRIQATLAHEGSLLEHINPHGAVVAVVGVRHPRGHAARHRHRDLQHSLSTNHGIIEVRVLRLTMRQSDHSGAAHNGARGVTLVSRSPPVATVADSEGKYWSTPSSDNASHRFFQDCLPETTPKCHMDPQHAPNANLTSHASSCTPYTQGIARHRHPRLLLRLLRRRHRPRSQTCSLMRPRRHLRLPHDFPGAQETCCIVRVTAGHHTALPAHRTSRLHLPAAQSTRRLNSCPRGTRTQTHRLQLLP